MGSTERQRRYRYAGVCGVAAVAYAVGVLATSAPIALLLGLFVPLSFGTELLLQARRSSRANPDCRGRSDLGDEGSSVEGGGIVEDADGPLATDSDARRGDRRHALRLTVLGVLGGGAGAVLVYTAATVLG